MGRSHVAWAGGMSHGQESFPVGPVRPRTVMRATQAVEWPCEHSPAATRLDVVADLGRGPGSPTWVAYRGRNVS
jgi:hypothetical protein